MDFDVPRYPSRRPRGGPRSRLHTEPSHLEEQLADLLVRLQAQPVLAADERADYDAGDPDDPPVPEGPDPQPAVDIRQAVAEVRAAVGRLRAIVNDRTVSAGGELAGLAELLDTLDAAHATAVALTDRIESAGLAERRAGLPLEHLLGLKTNATFGERRCLTGAREVLRHLPNVAAAFDAGVIGWGQVRAIVAEARPLTVELRRRLDRGFADLGELGRLHPDEIIDRVSVAAAGLREDLERKRTVARQQRRYLHVQPSFDGG